MYQVSPFYSLCIKRSMFAIASPSLRNTSFAQNLCQEATPWFFPFSICIPYQTPLREVPHSTKFEEHCFLTSLPSTVPSVNRHTRCLAGLPARQPAGVKATVPVCVFHNFWSIIIVAEILAVLPGITWSLLCASAGKSHGHAL